MRTSFTKLIHYPLGNSNEDIMIYKQEQFLCMMCGQLPSPNIEVARAKLHVLWLVYTDDGCPVTIPMFHWQWVRPHILFLSCITKYQLIVRLARFRMINSHKGITWLSVRYITPGR